MFISFTFTETSINKTNKINQKVTGSKFMFIMSTVHMNTYTETTTVCSPDSVPDQRQHRCCHLDVQFAICHFWLSHNRIRFISLVDQVV